MKIPLIITLLFFQCKSGGDIVTKSGNHFKGTIVSVTQKEILINTDYGELKIPLKEVKTLKSEKLFFYTKDKKTYNLSITGIDPVKIIIYTPSMTLPVQKLKMVSCKKKKITGMDLNIGLGFSTGNAESQSYSLGLQFYLKPSPHSLTLRLNSNFSRQNKENSVDYQRSNLDYTYTLRDKVMFSFNSLSERDGIAKLNLRSINSGKTGFGINVFWGSDLYISGGLSFFYEDYQNGEPPLKELRLTVGVNMVFSFSNFDLNFENNVYTSPEDPSKLLVQSQLTIKAAVNNFFSTFISVLDSFNNKPASGNKKNDLILNGGFSFSI